MGRTPKPVPTIHNGRTRSELLFLGGVISVALIAAIAFLALTAWSICIPAMGISLLFGIAVATLAYAFLGAKGDDTFKVRAFQVTGAAAVVLAVVWISNAALERQFGLNVCRGSTDPQLIIDQEMPPVRIVGGGSVDLLSMNTLNGWEETGGHLENVNRSDPTVIFEELFQVLDINQSVENVLAMSDEEWNEFLARLPERKRLLIGGIPFARIKVRSSDQRPAEHTVFKNKQISVLNKSNEAEACLTVDRVLDVRERQSGEPEVLVLNQNRGACA